MAPMGGRSGDQHGEGGEGHRTRARGPYKQRGGHPDHLKPTNLKPPSWPGLGQSPLNNFDRSIFESDAKRGARILTSCQRAL